MIDPNRINSEFSDQFSSAISDLARSRRQAAQERARLEHELRMARRRIQELEAAALEDARAVADGLLEIKHLRKAIHQVKTIRAEERETQRQIDANACMELAVAHSRNLRDAKAEACEECADFIREQIDK